MPDDKASLDSMLERERIANRVKHWVRLVTACNSRCLFCLDMDTPRNLFLGEAEIKAEIDRGIDELGADKIILSGGEGTLHPKFLDFVRYAKERGYDRVQTVTNGYRFGDRDFLNASLDAGLGEITFSLHGHTAELHDYLTQTPGAFDRLIKGMVRSLRDGRPVVNVDVCINKQNVGVLDKIVELCIRLGVGEFDLLHVIPQAAAYENRDELFYDVREYLPVLQKVFRLNRHPGFYIWTNRFPVSYLEGLEELIQDPHKMLDEVNGRRHQVRAYLDIGKPLDCREPERCVHCFIEPFCTYTDRILGRSNEAAWEVWWMGDDSAAIGEAPPSLPYGCTSIGLPIDDWQTLQDLNLPDSMGLYLLVGGQEPIPEDVVRRSDVRLVVESAAKCEAWLVDAPKADGLRFVIHLNRDTAPWLLEHRELLEALRRRIVIHQPSYESMAEAAERDVRDPKAFFETLNVSLPVSGLPACLAPGSVITEPLAVLDGALFDKSNGRPIINALAHNYVRDGYFAKSVRCADCRVNERCDGAHINMIRDQGLTPLTPLVEGEWADNAVQQLETLYPQPPARLAKGRKPEPAIPSLPGFEQPDSAPEDPLAIVADKRDRRRERRLNVLPQA